MGAYECSRRTEIRLPYFCRIATLDYGIKHALTKRQVSIDNRRMQ